MRSGSSVRRHHRYLFRAGVHGDWHAEFAEAIGDGFKGGRRPSFSNLSAANSNPGISITATASLTASSTTRTKSPPYGAGVREWGGFARSLTARLVSRGHRQSSRRSVATRPPQHKTPLARPRHSLPYFQSIQLLARCRRHPRQPWRPFLGEHPSPGGARPNRRWLPSLARAAIKVGSAVPPRSSEAQR